jgi:iron complex outermembrane receptor protein
MKSFPRTSLYLSLLAAAGLSAAPSHAQMVLEEVIVTANKIESNLMETAVAVTAFDSNMLSELGIDDQYDISARTPSLTIAPSRISIRGVGRPNIALGSDPGVGLYWDGVYNTENDIFGYSNFLDIDRLEVLRGPQGTLYGRNSIGGAINLISKQPTDEWEGKVVGQYGNYDSYVAQGLVSGPITEKLTMLAALSQIERQEGFQKNVDTGEDYDLDESTYGTLALKHQTTDRWTNSLKVFAQNGDRTRSNPYVLEPFTTDFIQEVFDQDTGEQLNFPGMFPGTNFALMQAGMTRDNVALTDPENVSINPEHKPYVENERKSVTFISQYDADKVSIKYTGGYSEFDYSSDYDADGTRSEDSGLDWSKMTFAGVPVSLFTGHTLTPSDLTRPFFQEAEFQSHELQFTSDLGGAVNFIGGLYYYQSDEKQGLAFIEHNDDLMDVYRFFGQFTGGAVSESGDLFRGVSELETKSYAVYGQMSWDISDATMVTVGARYSRDEKDGKDNTFAQYVGDSENPTVYRQTDDDWSQPTWRVGGDHFINDDHLLYGFIATGYPSGGFNLMNPTDSTDVGTVDPEELLSFEVGYKGSLLENRLNFTGAAYFYDYQDLQVTKRDTVNGIQLNNYENAAEAEAWGLEAEVTALITEGLTFNGSWSYNKTEYKDFDSIDANACTIGPLTEGNSQHPLCTETQDLSGNSFAHAPENKLSLNLIYGWEAMNLNWRVAGSYLYTDEIYMSAFNLDEFDKIDSWDRWDARFTVGSQDLTWEATAFVKNINDDREVILRDRPDPTAHGMVSALTDPRTYGVRLTYNF